MLWAIVGIGALLCVALVMFVFAASAVAKRADEQIERYLADTRKYHDDGGARCDVTGQPLTAAERFERESG